MIQSPIGINMPIGLIINFFLIIYYNNETRIYLEERKYYFMDINVNGVTLTLTKEQEAKVAGATAGMQPQQAQLVQQAQTIAAQPQQALALLNGIGAQNLQNLQAAVDNTRKEEKDDRFFLIRWIEDYGPTIGMTLVFLGLVYFFYKKMFGSSGDTELGMAQGALMFING